MQNSGEPQKTKLTWTKEILEKHFQIKDLGINNRSKYTQAM